MSVTLDKMPRLIKTIRVPLTSSDSLPCVNALHSRVWHSRVVIMGLERWWEKAVDGLTVSVRGQENTQCSTTRVVRCIGVGEFSPEANIA